MTYFLWECVSHLNTPYIWGGNHPVRDGGFDCSGFVNWCLMKCGMLSKKDRSSQMLYNEISQMGLRSSIEPESILFFGKDVHNITHVAVCLQDGLMIEAGGGDSTTTTIYLAAERIDARVRIKPIDNRSDLVASLVITETKEKQWN